MSDMKFLRELATKVEKLAPHWEAGKRIRKIAERLARLERFKTTQKKKNKND